MCNHFNLTFEDYHYSAYRKVQDYNLKQMIFVRTTTFYFLPVQFCIPKNYNIFVNLGDKRLKNNRKHTYTISTRN